MGVFFKLVVDIFLFLYVRTRIWGKKLIDITIIGNYLGVFLKRQICLTCIHNVRTNIFREIATNTFCLLRICFYGICFKFETRYFFLRLTASHCIIVCNVLLDTIPTFLMYSQTLSKSQTLSRAFVCKYD